jgi:TRAP-type C4-dicarboxylate transport system permease small subunit
MDPKHVAKLQALAPYGAAWTAAYLVARFVLSQPSTWTEESMRRLLIWMVMLGTVVALASLWLVTAR